MGFTKKNLVGAIRVKFTLPKQYPGTIFSFPMRLQLSREAAEAQAAFIGMTREERESASHPHNVSHLADLLKSEPEGFVDFPSDDRSLKERVTEYFSTDGLQADEAEAIETIVNHAMVAYWNAVLPRECL